MLLNDIGKSLSTTFRKINQHLEANYGFKIAEDVSDRDLVAIMEQIEGEISDLKIKGDDSKASPEISKRLLVLEGVKTLREFAILQFQSPDLERVVTGMVDFIVKQFRLAGSSHADFEEAVRDAMKQYRSSKYRFPDDLIEQRVRQGAMSKIQSMSNVEQGMGQGGNMEIDSMFEDDEITFEDEEMRPNEINEEDPWASVGKRASARGGHAAGELDKTQRNTLGKLGFKTDEPEEDPVPMIRDKNGRMVPDPFKAAARARSQGRVVSEKANLVKNLRRLLETEVSQAEVMMAAKGFAQELQEMIEKIGRLQNEDLPPVTDQMRETYGTDSSSAFQTQIYGALQGVMDSLYTAKTQVDDAVSSMASTGQFDAQTDMDLPVGDGMDDDLGMDDPTAMDADAEMDADLDNLAGDLEASDDFGGADEDEPLGRAMKESHELRSRILEMRKLVDKARRLRESKARA